MRYEVILNYFGENHQFYTHADNHRQAKRNAVTRLAHRVGKIRTFVSMHVNQGDKISIKEVENA